MNKRFLLDSFGWGLFLWLFGYLLSIVLFALVPPEAIGWIISPIGILLTLWVLTKKIEQQSIWYYLVLALTWTALALVGDYLFIVQLFKPTDVYYILDVYLYYVSTFLLPLCVGWVRMYKMRESVV
jgi:hypothetical protein